MKAMKALLIVSTLAAAGANAATSYNVTFNYETPVITDGGIIVPTSGGGSGTAILDDYGILRMTLHGELLSNYTNLYGGRPSYTDIIVDTAVLLNTTTNGAGTYNLVQAGSYTQYVNCVPGLQDNLSSCIFVPPGYTDLASGTDSFYSSQSFTLNGGNIRVAQHGSGVTLITDYSLAAVPLPASVWAFGSALGGLFGWSRRTRLKKVAA